MSEQIQEIYRNVKIVLDEKANRWGYCANRQRWTSETIDCARRKIDSLLDDEPQHNGANTNIYCDGQNYFVTGCPACDLAELKFMTPRIRRAKELADKLAGLGMTDTDYHADLWKISAKGNLNGQLLRIQELTGSREHWWL